MLLIITWCGWLEKCLLAKAGILFLFCFLCSHELCAADFLPESTVHGYTLIDGCHCKRKLPHHYEIQTPVITFHCTFIWITCERKISTSSFFNCRLPSYSMWSVFQQWDYKNTEAVLQSSLCASGDWAPLKQNWWRVAISLPPLDTSSPDCPVPTGQFGLSEHKHLQTRTHATHYWYSFLS